MLIETAERFVISPHKTKQLDRFIAQSKKPLGLTSREQQRKSSLNPKGLEEIRDRIVKGFIQTVQVKSLK
jgi:hypothetical protein